MPNSTDSKTLVLKKPLSKGALRLDPWLVAVLACFALFAWASWAKLDSPIIDVGREVEIPARLVDGQLLYRDIATYYGPLAYYVNALALLLFGHHLEVFYAVSLLLALLATLLFYRLSKQLTNARWAALGTTCFLLYCAFGSTLFNFIFPYSYGAPYAIVLCLFAFTFLERYAVRGQTRWLVAAAIACGLAGITKQEYGVAALGGILVGANIYAPQSLQTRIKRSILTLVTAGICAILPLALLAQQVSWKKIYLSLFPVSQVSVLNRSVLFQISPDKTFRSWFWSFVFFVAVSLVIWGSLAIARWLSKSKWLDTPRWVRSLFEILAGVAFSLLLLYLLRKLSFLNRNLDWDNLKPLVNLSWSLPVLVGWFAITRPRSPQDKNASLLWTLLVFSLLLNARWGFYINFYGLYAVTVVMLFFVLLYKMTRRIDKAAWCYLLVCLLIGSSMKLAAVVRPHYYEVRSSYGTFYTTDNSIATAFNQTVDFINTSKASSVLVLPEGNLLNFLSATHSPSLELTFLPPVLPTAKDEQEFLTRMQANPPELIVYVPRSFQEWGYQTYGEFNPIVDRWITQQHRLVRSFPMNEGAIRIYERQ